MLLTLLLQISTTFKSLHDLLGSLYDEMMPLCANFINIGRALGGLGALAFIGSSIWRSIVNAEPIDFFPLLRPFAIGLAIALFPLVLGALNGVLKPLANATDSLVQDQNKVIIGLQERKEALLKSKNENQPFENDAAFDKELEGKNWYDGSKAGLYFDKMAYDVNKNFRQWMKQALELAHDSASLVLNTIQTFFLIVLSIVGPISFGFAIWPGFEGTLVGWLSRYINIALWVPVANIYGAIIAKIEVVMIGQDIANIQAGADASTADYAYMIFLVIAIAGYFTVPNVAGWIIQASGVQQALSRVSSVTNAVGSAAGGVAGAAAGRFTGGAAAIGGAMLADTQKTGVTPNFKNTAV